MSLTMFIPASHQDESSSSSLETIEPCRQLTFSEIQLATQNFDESLVIGCGGFGKVYKGTITNGGGSLLTVAIKRLDATSNQGALEFWAEVKMLSKLRHCHLVSLIGYCNDQREMILVYEYMPRGTLEDHLHKHLRSLPWVRRLQICIGAARGLDYLHTGTGINHGVIHRDVKSSNILLHESWAAKISDFGLSKIGPTNQPSTSVSTMVKGTFGYLDPHYYSTGRLTRKSDVYAFGVVLFEVLCGKRAVDRSIDEEQWGLASWAQDSIKEGRLKQIVDCNMKGEISPKCLKEFARLADRCLHNHPKHRPTMAEVVVGLESVLAIQKKANTTLQPAGITIFGRKVPMFVFPSNRENSDGNRSLRSLELYLNTLRDENGIRRFDFDTLDIATEKFSDANKFSRYGYSDNGSMYKGRLQDGKDIAIAGPSFPSFVDHIYFMNDYFMNEASILIKLEHDNLIKLLGYCIKGTIVFLVYEFSLYTRLDCLIFDPVCTLLESWNKRFKIILDVARVLFYLHKIAPSGILHCNVNPGNILLDEYLCPTLSDFGFARAINESEGIHSGRVFGTIGYVAPECECLLPAHHLSTKADVYSFGVLVLNIISGKRAFDLTRLNQDDEVLLVQHIRKNWLEETYLNIIDPKIDVDSSFMIRFIEIGLLCVQEDATVRPTMEEVVDMLLGNTYITLLVLQMHTRMIRECSDGIIDMVDDDYDASGVEEDIANLSPR